MPNFKSRGRFKHPVYCPPSGSFNRRRYLEAEYPIPGRPEWGLLRVNLAHPAVSVSEVRRAAGIMLAKMKSRYERDLNKAILILNGRPLNGRFLSQRDIARRLNISRDRVKRVLAERGRNV